MKSMKKNVGGRKKKEPNKIILRENYAEMVLYNKDDEEVARALIDLDDIEKVKEYRWCLTDGYVVHSRRKKQISMHRLIMDFPRNKVVDHIHHNRLDNRKSQLRVCTQKENSRNSKAKGYALDGGGKKWEVYISINGKSEIIGRFKTEKEALKVRKEAEIKHYGEFSYYKGLDNK